MNVFALRLGSYSTLADNFRNTVRHAAAVLVPDVSERAHARVAERFPALAEMRAAGSLALWLRYLNERGDRMEFVVEEHEIGTSPGTPSLVGSIDLLRDVDPSFLVQAALWDAVSGVSRDDEAVARSMEADIARDIALKRGSGQPDSEILGRYRAWGQRMAGIPVASMAGTPSKVLDRLPEATAELFVDLASQLPVPGIRLSDPTSGR
jgi:hypothetical protein